MRRVHLPAHTIKHHYNNNNDVLYKHIEVIYWIKVSVRYLWGWEGGFQSRRPAGRRPAAGTPWGERREERGETGDPPELQTPFTTGPTPPTPPCTGPPPPRGAGKYFFRWRHGMRLEPTRKERKENLEKVAATRSPPVTSSGDWPNDV